MMADHIRAEPVSSSQYWEVEVEEKWTDKYNLYGREPINTVMEKCDSMEVFALQWRQCGHV